MKRFIILFMAVACIGIQTKTNASPAFPKPITFTQPDGQSITIQLKGDEHSKWASTTDGYSLIFNGKGYYEYATLDSRGYMVPSGVIAKNIQLRTSSDINFLENIPKDVRYAKEQLQMLRNVRQIKRTEAKRAFPTTGDRKLICILMGFKDKAFTKTQSDFENLFNQVNYTTNGATGSVKDYYQQNSYGKFNLSVTVKGPYTASQNMVYYGGNDSDGYDLHPDSLVSEAVRLANPDVNYADFDNDKDGNVDGIYIIYAGYGEEAGASTNAIWAHAWEIPTVNLDGKNISAYSCSAELENNSGSTMTGIGVICHEFGHVLGAPDYYDVDYEENGQFDGTGDWDIMSGGSWNNDGITPAHHNAYTKVYIYHWATASELTTTTSKSLPSSKSDETAFYRINTPTTNEFYLLENRQQEGFDAYIPGHGLLIYHVHKDIDTHMNSNDINAQAPQMMYPVCASATINPGSSASSYGSINSSGCTFPGTTNKTSFTDNSTPSAKSWAGTNTLKPITNIVENTSTNVITFDFMGLMPGFTADKTTIFPNDPVIFTDASFGNPSSWQWNFGENANPATATTVGPHTVTYSTMGSKTITLTVNGTLTETKSAYISVVDPTAPTTIVGWNFEDKDQVADNGIPINASKTIACSATGSAGSSSGSGGTGTYSLSNSGWNNGSGIKAWSIEFSTIGYSNISISSKQKSSNTGTKDFKLQYSIGGGSWSDVNLGSTTVANDNFVSGTLSNIELPADANNQQSISARWIMTSNNQVNSGSVASTGTNRIDDIVVLGKKTETSTPYSLTITHTGNGTTNPVDGIYNYNSGSLVTLTASADEGYKFSKWTINGSDVPTSSTQLTITTNTTAEAVFTPNTGIIDNIVSNAVFPNPFTSTLSISNNSALIKNVWILDLTGKVIIQRESINLNKTSFELPDLKPGSYLVRIENNQGNIQMSKIIKN